MNELKQNYPKLEGYSDKFRENNFTERLKEGYSLGICPQCGLKIFCFQANFKGSKILDCCYCHGGVNQC